MPPVDLARGSEHPTPLAQSTASDIVHAQPLRARSQPAVAPVSVSRKPGGGPAPHESGPVYSRHHSSMTPPGITPGITPGMAATSTGEVGEVGRLRCVPRRKAAFADLAEIEPISHHLQPTWSDSAFLWHSSARRLSSTFRDGALLCAAARSKCSAASLSSAAERCRTSQTP